MSGTKTLAMVALLLLVALLVFLLGPRVPIDTRTEPVALPADLEAWLAAREAAVPNLMPGAEKTIRWAGAPGERTALAVVYLHGFSDSRQSLSPVPETLARRLGANFFATRLTGHGRDGAAMAEASVNDWLQDGLEALAIGERLGERVILMGLSTGGTLATWLAATQDDAPLAAVLLVSPNYGPADARARILTWPWGGQIARLVEGEERVVPVLDADHERIWQHRYPTRALLPMMGLVQLLARTDLAASEVPTLMVYSPDDQVVDVAAIERIFGRLEAPKAKVAFTASTSANQHVLAGDAMSPAANAPLLEVLLAFLAEQNLAPAPADQATGSSPASSR